MSGYTVRTEVTPASTCVSCRGAMQYKTDRPGVSGFQKFRLVGIFAVPSQPLSPLPQKVALAHRKKVATSTEFTIQKKSISTTLLNDDRFDCYSATTIACMLRACVFLSFLCVRVRFQYPRVGSSQSQVQ